MPETTEKPQKPDLFRRTLHVLLDPRVLIPVLAALGIGGGSGWVMADAGGARTISEDTVRSIADSTTRAQLAPVKSEIKALREITEGVFGAWMETDTNFRAAVQSRAQKNQEARRKKAADSALLNDLTGGSP